MNTLAYASPLYPHTLTTMGVGAIYYEGDIQLLHHKPLIAVIGTRKPTELGERRAVKLVSALVAKGFTIVSGLAAGIDTIAHTTAMNARGKTIAVLGTPLNEYYPRENRTLQQAIAQDHLVISQFTPELYSATSFEQKRRLFPERNKTMSAISDATIIVEAHEKSGTLVQAKAAIRQGKKLFILNSCYENYEWPASFPQAIRVRSVEDIKV